MSILHERENLNNQFW